MLKAISPSEDPTATNVTLDGSNQLQVNTANSIFKYTAYSVWVKGTTAGGAVGYVEVQITLTLDCETHTLTPQDAVNPVAFTAI